MEDPNTSNQTPAPSQVDAKWQQDLINRLAFASLNEQRRTRRWNIFFKSLMFAYLFFILLLIYYPDSGETAKLGVGKHTAMVDVTGVIAENADASADNIVTGLRAAFEDSNTAGIILRINSPGGSPVQAGYVYDEIKRLRGKHPAIRVYAVVADMCASGGYYIASAADEIYADKASIVGSIGVLMNGFGFTKGMEKLGVERRLYTAGEHKGMLDPFSPEKPSDVAHIKKQLAIIHQQFIDAVKTGRGERLSNDPNLFSGMFWTGEQGMRLGLVDGLGSPGYVAREVIKAEDIVDYTPRRRLLERFAERIGASAANAMMKISGLSAEPNLQ